MSGRLGGVPAGPVVDHRDPADVDPGVTPVRALPVEHGDEIAAADHPVVGVEVGVHEAGWADIGHRRPQPGVQGAARRDPRRFGGLVQQLPPVVDDGRERRRRPPGRGRRRGVDAGQHPHGLGEHGVGRCGRAALGEHVAGRSARHAVDDEVRGAEPRAVLTAPPQPRRGHAVLGQRGEQRGLPVHVRGGAAARPQRRHAQHQTLGAAGAAGAAADVDVERPGDAGVAGHAFEAVHVSVGSEGVGRPAPEPVLHRRGVVLPPPRLLSRGRHQRRPRRAPTAWPP